MFVHVRVLVHLYVIVCVCAYMGMCACVAASLCAYMYVRQCVCRKAGQGEGRLVATSGLVLGKAAQRG